MDSLWMMGSLMIAGAMAHEGAHIMEARRRGGKWAGIRWKGLILSVVIDTTRLTTKDRRAIAWAGLLTDSLGLLVCTLWYSHTLAKLPIAGMIWFAASAAINSCPFIPASDGWRLHYNQFGLKRTIQPENPAP
ncbi:MAG: hypothetical protein M0Z53_00540 [Thermaerobacter sp.]|nr:hypothetical protein [Thermaerobacter sp.]